MIPPVSHELPRRRLLQAASASLAVAAVGCGPRAGGRSAATPIRFGGGASAVAAVAAREAGVFERLGLQVDVLPLKNGPSAVAATVAGALDFTFGDFLGWVAALSNGFVNSRLIAPANATGNQVILARKGSGVVTPADLVGRKVGVAAAPVFSLSVRLWLRRNGVDPAQVQLVVIEQGPEHVLGRGDVDAILVADPNAYQAIAQYGATILAGDPSAEVMPAGAGRACYYVNADFLKARPETVTRVVQALREGGQLFLQAAPVDRARLMEPYVGLGVAKMQAQMPGLIESFRYPPVQLGGFDVAANQSWVDIAVRERALPRPQRIAEFVDARALAAT
ncbi:ABC transporter substrate-binding protein [Brevundimonas sp. VNH65]|uniref:ABC transporter substrate-binding protein n=1 Tax=Brevundimonas sp. VNH65 TaxID=3400917 RepID=UPI003BFAF42F